MSSSKAGVLRIYNAANPNCKEIIKVSKHGIIDMIRMTDHIYLLKLANGQIIQFNIHTNVHEYSVPRSALPRTNGTLLV